MTRTFKALYKAVIVLLAVFAALFMGSLVLFAIGADVLRVYVVLLTEPLKNVSLISEVALRAIPLSIIAFGIAIAYRSGFINIGGEGQMLIGILSATAAALAFPALPRVALLPLVLLAGFAGGAVWGFVPGVLKVRFEVNEVLSTVMLNYIASQLYTFCLRGPLIDPAEITLGSGTPQSMRLPRSIYLDRLIPGTRLHGGVFIVFFLAAAVYFLLWRTSFGYKMRASGSEIRAARYGGINVGFYLVCAISISGALSGLAGAVELEGVHHRAIEGITSGYGFSAIVVALFGGLHPAGILPASFFFGLLIVGSDMTQRLVGVPANMVQVLQGIIILVIVSAKMIIANPYIEERVWRRCLAFKGRLRLAPAAAASASGASGAAASASAARNGRGGGK